jgi:hypothetical protein
MKIVMSLAVAIGLSVFMTPMANAQYRGAVRPPAVRPPAVRPTAPMPKNSAPVIAPKLVTPSASTNRPSSTARVSPRNSCAAPKAAFSSSTSTKATTPTRPGNAGRSGRQQHLRNLLNDPSVSRADKGWIKSEIRQIENGNRSSIRVPPGKELAHTRGREAAKGYSYEHSKLNLSKDHRNQHRYDNYGRANKERPLTPPSPKPTSTSNSSSSLSPKTTSTSSSGTTPTTVASPRPSSSSSTSVQFARNKK